MSRAVFYVFTLLMTSYFLHHADGSEARYRLLTKILLNYSKYLPPTTDSTDPLKIAASISVKSISNVDEKAGTAEIYFWLYQNWTDEKVAWNRTQFDIAYLVLSRESLWTPDTAILHGKEIQQNIAHDATIQNSGQVSDLRFFQATVPCVRQRKWDDAGYDVVNGGRIDGKPTLLCSLAIGCRVEPIEDIVFDAIGFDIDALYYGSEWDLHSTRSYNATVQTIASLPTISRAVFDIVLVKDAADVDVSLQIVVSSILTTLMSIGVFFLPPLAGERIVTAGMAFLGQLLLTGLGLLLQIESKSSTKVRNLTLFSTVFVFLVEITVIVSFFVFPLCVCQRTKPERTVDEEDRNHLLKLSETKVYSAIPDAILCIIFVVVYCIGTATILV
ncbi:5-hydroxytryptamine receptor 3A-like [Diadema antillarum]|uniref:5-hydroxytryptamine receptor 3A-like n=1 Tax=Diadema antillarum TaxID=105358 RepID=UPI003A8ACD93